MTALLRDLRLAVRVLLHTKSWTLVVLVSLGARHRREHGAVHRRQRPAAADRAGPRARPLVRFNWAGKNDMVRSSSDYGYSGASGTRNVRSTFSFADVRAASGREHDLTGLAAGAPMGG